MFDDYDVLWEEEMRVWEQEREEREWREDVEDAGVGGNVVLNRAPMIGILLFFFVKNFKKNAWLMTNRTNQNN